MAKSKRSDTAVPDDDWRAESDMNTLIEAHKIRADKKRHAAAKAVAKKRLAALTDLANGKAT